MSELLVKTFTLGPWATNCYVVAVGRWCWIVDASFDPEPMLDWIEQQGMTPLQVVLTHAHVDHIAGLPQVRQRWPEIPIVIHEAERNFPGDTALNLSIMLADPVVAPDPTTTLKHGDTLTLTPPDDPAGAVRFEVRHTPGHSPGGICLYQPDHNLAIVGDTLFNNSIGRYDFPTSNGTQLFQSIREQLLTLPETTRILPGHGPETTIAQERQTNPYL